MTLTKLHEGVGDYLGVPFEFTIIESDGTKFFELSCTMPGGRAATVVGTPRFATVDEAIAGAKKYAEAAIEKWLRNTAA
jgi:hypothetical protein